LHRQQPMGGTAPVGFAFEIADLALLQGWAASHELRMVVELDHCVADREYEEIVVIYAKDNGFRRWHLWRSAGEVVVKPLIGRSSRFISVADAIEAISPTRS
jgi:hypothetical protein